MIDPGPICSMCTRDWDERLGYCEHCARTAEDLRSNANTAGLWEDNFS